jgi:hypothetical protein
MFESMALTIRGDGVMLTGRGRSYGRGWRRRGDSAPFRLEA